MNEKVLSFKMDGWIEFIVIAQKYHDKIISFDGLSLFIIGCLIVRFF